MNTFCNRYKIIHIIAIMADKVTFTLKHSLGPVSVLTVQATRQYESI